MAVPRRLIVIAASALAAGAALYVRNKMRDQKERAERGASSSGASGSASGAATATTADASAGSPSAAASAPGVARGDAPAGSLRELSQFLAGESWYDEVGWQGIWEREGIESPDAWLRSKGRDVLATERTKLTEHPALLAGCRRRWIVVCRYAGIDVADAASLWTQTETAAA